MLPDRLRTLTSRDMMSRDLLVLRDDMSVADAIETLQHGKHSGAPVVDNEGRLVGTVSLRDIARTKSPKIPQGDDSALISHEMISGWKYQDKNLASVMRCDPPHVSEHERLIDIARLMCHVHMHKVPVINAHRKLVGLITTMDILAALVAVVDELD